MDTLLKIGLVKGLSYPDHFQQPYEGLDSKSKREWNKYIFDKVFALSCAETRREVRRELHKSEVGLIERRVKDFLNKTVSEGQN